MIRLGYLQATKYQIVDTPNLIDLRNIPMAEAADEQKPQASTSAVILSNSIDTSVMSSRAK